MLSSQIDTGKPVADSGELHSQTDKRLESETPSSPPAHMAQNQAGPNEHNATTTIDSRKLPSPVNERQTKVTPPPSHARNRMSLFSASSHTSNSAPPSRSRPTSHSVSPWPSGLSYAFVRDFAYPEAHPLHYGFSTESTVSTPVSEQNAHSPAPWDSFRSSVPAPAWNPEAMYSTQQLPATSFRDGPPYSEDEDLMSPVVISSRQRKAIKSPINSGEEYQSVETDDDFPQSVLVGVGGDGSQTYYVGDGEEADDGPGGEYVTYAPDEAHANDGWGDTSRFSRDYQFSIVSPDEEMHGKAVALFDFTREHENELPLSEGQVILVSYRHGQGWLVAEDPKTGESGLVPEEFVRLLRDIEGGLMSLTTSDFQSIPVDETDLETDTQTNSALDVTEQKLNGVTTNDSGGEDEDKKDNSNGNNDSKEKDKGRNTGKDKDRPAIVSTFSTSSKDLNPYPLTQRTSMPAPSSERYEAANNGGNKRRTPKSQSTSKNLMSETKSS